MTNFVKHAAQFHRLFKHGLHILAQAEVGGVYHGLSPSSSSRCSLGFGDDQQHGIAKKICADGACSGNSVRKNLPAFL